MSGRQARRVLERHGFTCVRQRGSHMVMQGVVDGRSRTVSVPDHAELAAGTLAAIARQSGLPRSLFR